MVGMCPYVIKLTYYDYPTRAIMTKNVLTYGVNMNSAIQHFEDEYGDDLIGVSIHVVADKGYEFEVSDEMANEFIKKDGALADPVAIGKDPKREDDF